MLEQLYDGNKANTKQTFELDDRYKPSIRKSIMYSREKKRRLVCCPSCNRSDGWERPPKHKKYNPDKTVICKYCDNVSGIDIKLTHYQLRVMHDLHFISGNVGAVGTGKTTVISVKKIMIASIVSGSTHALTSGTLTQLKDTTYKELIKFLPPRLLEKAPTMSGTGGGNIKLINGSEMLFVVANDDNLRSLNLLTAHVEEASAVDEEVFTQMTKRMRENKQESEFFNESQTEKANRGLFDKYTQVTVTTNPEDNWVIPLVIAKAGHIRNYTYFNPPETINASDEISVHIASTMVNYFLSKAYIQRIIDGCTSEEDIRASIGGDFTVKAGRVVNNLNDYIVHVTPEAIGEVSFKIAAVDYGMGEPAGDPQAFLVGVFSLRPNYRTGSYDLKVFFYKEDYAKGYKKPEEHKIVYERILGSDNIPLYKVLGDNIDGNKRKYDDNKVTPMEKYDSIGFEIEGALNSRYDIHQRANIMKELYASDFIRIDVNCKELISETKGYTRKAKSKNATSKTKPLYTGADHLIDCKTSILLEFYENGIGDPVGWFMRIRDSLVKGMSNDSGEDDFLDYEII